MNKEQKIFIVDDDESVSSGLGILFSENNLKSEIYSSGEQFILMYEGHPELQNQVGIIFLDVRMPGMSGIEVFYRLVSKFPQLRHPVIFLTAHGELPMAVQMVKSGAHDFVQKPFDSKNLVHTAHSTMELSRARVAYFEIQEDMKNSLSTLTDKEKLVMSLLMDGLTNRQIAEKMQNSVRTIELHRANVFDKLGVKNAVELVRIWEQFDLSSS